MDDARGLVVRPPRCGATLVLAITVLASSPAALGAAGCRLSDAPDVMGRNASETLAQFEQYKRWCRGCGGSIPDSLEAARAQGECRLPEADGAGQRAAPTTAEGAALRMVQALGQSNPQAQARALMQLNTDLLAGAMRTAILGDAEAEARRREAEAQAEAERLRREEEERQRAAALQTELLEFDAGADAGSGGIEGLMDDGPGDGAGAEGGFDAQGIWRPPTVRSKRTPPLAARGVPAPASPAAGSGGSLADQLLDDPPPAATPAKPEPLFDAYGPGQEHGSRCFERHADTTCAGLSPERYSACVSSYGAGYEAGAVAVQLRIARARQAGVGDGSVVVAGPGAAPAKGPKRIPPDAIGECGDRIAKAYREGYDSVPPPAARR